MVIFRLILHPVLKAFLIALRICTNIIRGTTKNQYPFKNENMQKSCHLIKKKVVSLTQSKASTKQNENFFDNNKVL